MAIENELVQTRLDDETIEIRLSDITTFLKNSRRRILLGALGGGIVGAIYAFSLPNQYTSQITVLPEIQAKSGAGLSGSLGSLAGLAGIDVGNLSGNSDAVRPELYPNVVQSIPFALDLLQRPVYSNEFKRTEPLSSYLQEKIGSGWLNNLPSFSRSDDAETTTDTSNKSGTLQITKAQETLAKKLQELVTAAYDKKTGVLTITSVMPDPVIAASTARLSLNYLTEYITTYRTEKARREVDFLTKQVSSAKKRYQEAEYALSAYRDQNRSVFLNTAKIEEQRIQAEFLLAQDLYNTLSKQTEMAKIKVQEETPVFKTLEPARVPLKKSGPKRSAYLLGFSFLGIVIGLTAKFLKP